MEESLYYAEIKLLTFYCQACLDKKMKQKLMMFLMKHTLWRNALDLGFTADAEKYYNEMLILLDMKTCDAKPNCKNCQDGYCALC